MNIIIEGKKAELKENLSFEFYFENRLFEGRDSYTLALSFPLVDCPKNRSIFGHLERKDIAKEKVFYECEIQCGMISAVGSIIITGVSESEIKAQFVEGRCEQVSVDPLDEIYINEQNIGAYPSEGSYTPVQAWSGTDEVALPWINKEYPDQYNNWVKFVNGGYIWANDRTSTVSSRSGSGASSTHRPTGGEFSESALPAQSLSWQPYLITIAKRICMAIDYDYDFTEWEASPIRYLIVCNTLPYTWNRQYKDILPHWTVTEFFEKLELLLLGEFNIDHRLKVINFRFTQNELTDLPPVKIDKVVDEYSVEISDNPQGCSYIFSKRLMYKECSHEMQPFYACDWFMSVASVRGYDTLSQLISANRRHMITDGNGNQWPAYGEGAHMLELRNPMVVNDVNVVLHARDIDKYFVMRSIGTELIAGYRPGGYAQIYVLQPINSFGSGMPESDDAEDVEIEFVPVCITDTYIDEEDDMGYMMQLSFGSYQDDSEYMDVDDASSARQPRTTSALISGENNKSSEYYDVIYVGLWDGNLPTDGKSPCPLIDDVSVDQDWSVSINHLPNLRISQRLAEMKTIIHEIDTAKKFKFSFLSDKIPNPRSVFFIEGKRYLCEKITATFSKDGMSQLLKGDFFAITD